MNQQEFWELIERANLSEFDDPYEWDQPLQNELRKLPAEEIVEWNHILDQYAKDVYSLDMWGAAYLINGGRIRRRFLLLSPLAYWHGT